MSDIDPRQELRRIRRMPYGAARSAAAEAVTRKVEAEGPREVLAEALLDLIEAYTFWREGHKSFAVFARLLRLWDTEPESFDMADRRNLFWEFKWVAADLSEYPVIAPEQAEAFLADMERRFDLEGLGKSSVAMSRFRWLWHAGLPGMEQARVDWVTTARDDMDDCAACTVGQQADYFAELGEWEQAAQIGRTIDSSCNREPTRTYYALALATYMTGDPAEAMHWLRQANATLEAADGDAAPSRGHAFQVLARGGQIEQALIELRNRDAEMLREAESPAMRLRFLIGVYAGLSANLDQPDLATGLRQPGGVATLGELHQWVEHEIAELGSAFDRRSGTDYYRSLAERARAATRGAPVKLGSPALVAPLEQDAAGASPVAGAQEKAAQDPDAQELGGQGQGAQSLDAGEFLALAESSARGRKYAEAAAHYQAAGHVLLNDGRLIDGGLAFAESAMQLTLAGDDQAANETFAVAVPCLRAGEAPFDVLTTVLLAWAPNAAKVAAPELTLEVINEVLGETVAPDTSGDTEELAARRNQEFGTLQGQLRDARARLLAESDDATEVEFARTEALGVAEQFASLGQIALAAHAFWLAGKIAQLSEKPEDASWALESAFEGFTQTRSTQHRAEVAGDLLELFRSTGQVDRAEALTAQLTE